MLRTVWKGHYSRLFSATNGIRQGGVISPMLLCVHIDEVLNRLERKGHGCWVGNHFYGAFSYADDMKILCPSVKGLRKMMKICGEFGKEYGVKYNPTKTVCVRFSKKEGSAPEIHLSGTPLKWVKSVKDLGIVDSDLRETTEIRHTRGDLIGRVNTMMANLGKCPDKVTRKVFNTQCGHFYGAQAWNLTNSAIKDFQVMWNRCIRRVLEVHFATHTGYLPHLIGTKTALDQISERFVGR